MYYAKLAYEAVTSKCGLLSCAAAVAGAVGIYLGGMPIAYGLAGMFAGSVLTAVAKS
jgi:hypothetical protein